MHIIAFCCYVSLTRSGTGVELCLRYKYSHNNPSLWIADCMHKHARCYMNECWLTAAGTEGMGTGMHQPSFCMLFGWVPARWTVFLTFSLKTHFCKLVGRLQHARTACSWGHSGTFSLPTLWAEVDFWRSDHKVWSNSHLLFIWLDRWLNIDWAFVSVRMSDIINNIRAIQKPRWGQIYDSSSHILGLKWLETRCSLCSLKVDKSTHPSFYVQHEKWHWSVCEDITARAMLTSISMSVGIPIMQCFKLTD